MTLIWNATLSRFNIVSRGEEGTTARLWAAGSNISHDVTAVFLNNITPPILAFGFGHGWATMATAPGGVGSGGSLVYTGGDFIYAFQGGTNVFWRYSISGNSWAVMAVAPAAVWSGGSLVYTGLHIYAFQGNNTTAFWQFTGGRIVYWEPWMR